ncbi:cupin domain-containing protein [Helicobacter pametensis]|uniref:cupin domain-containing protein n=1 Tax=Helicobacter pametensis TaxID=95149 RepID=UPI0004AEC570|nr:cupin domain-containing protein [Helicobacter pametensis]
MTKVIHENGMQIKNEQFMLVKKSGAQGEAIQRHNHPGYSILFTVVSGHVIATLNDQEDFDLKPGEVLSFDGENFISAKFAQDSQVFITLIKQ